MYLIFELTSQGFRYGTYNAECECIYSGFYEVADWSQRTVSAVFTTHLLPKLRGHGKLFTKVGIIVPFADPKHVAPEPAALKTVQALGTTVLRKKILEPTALLLQSSQKTWPHLPHYFLFDTFLSAQLTRNVALPPFDYDTAHSLNIQPYLLHSYGHAANVNRLKDGKYAVSLYVGEQTSLALFEGQTLRDAVVTYSPLSSLVGIHGSGALDPGFYLDLTDKKRLPELQKLFLDKTGLQPMTETHHSLDELLQIAGLAKRDDSINMDNISIETIEWIELSVRSYLRSLRHAIGALATFTSEPVPVIANTSVLGESSGFWKVLAQQLPQTKFSYCNTSVLEAACHDLIHKHS